MERTDLSILAAFLAIAEQRSFTKAGKRLGVSPSAMSHAIRGLEEGLGVRLLSRTTRSVAPTDAGEQLLARLRPALIDVQEALHQLSGLRDKPAGRVRLLVPRLAGTALPSWAFLFGCFLSVAATCLCMRRWRSLAFRTVISRPLQWL